MPPPTKTIPAVSAEPTPADSPPSTAKFHVRSSGAAGEAGAGRAVCAGPQASRRKDPALQKRRPQRTQPCKNAPQPMSCRAFTAPSAFTDGGPGCGTSAAGPALRAVAPCPGGGGSLARPVHCLTNSVGPVARPNRHPRPRPGAQATDRRKKGCLSKSCPLSG